MPCRLYTIAKSVLHAITTIASDSVRILYCHVRQWDLECTKYMSSLLAPTFLISSIQPSQPRLILHRYRTSSHHSHRQYTHSISICWTSRPISYSLSIPFQSHHRQVIFPFHFHRPKMSFVSSNCILYATEKLTAHRVAHSLESTSSSQCSTSRDTLPLVLPARSLAHTLRNRSWSPSTRWIFPLPTRWLVTWP